ncbi:MAG: zonular occludens toxin domain-containing protein [Cellvibrio sp.]
MSVFIVTGKLGNGKTLVTVGRIRDAMRAGLRIATNLDLDLVAMHGPTARKCDVIRLPDKPSIEDLDGLGLGSDVPADESKYGLLVLDECGTWFNTRNWNDKSRKAVNDWFLHSRKFRWHVYLIIQDESLLDSQAREAIAEMIVRCRRLDNLRVPFFGAIVKMLTGIRLTLPKIHRAKVTYADGDLIYDVWTYRGTDLYSAYNTEQVFLDDYPHANYCLLSPWHIKGRYRVPMNWRNMMRITKIHWRRFKSPVAFATGLLLGAFALLLKLAQVPEPAPVVVESPAEVAAPSDQPNPVIDRLKTMYISGSMQTRPNEVELEFRSHGDVDRYYMSADLRQMGITVLAKGTCFAELQFSGVTVPVGCLPNVSM